MKPSDFKHAVFHMPNGKFPQMAGRQLGFTKEQLEAGWIIPWMGSTYSGSSPTGLTAILDVANPGDLIFTHDYYDSNRKVRDVPDENISKEVFPMDVVHMALDPTFVRYDEDVLKETRIIGWRKL